MTKIFYNRRDADSWESWAEYGGIDECPDCREARIQCERDEANAAAKAAAEKAGLPELSGSEKQIAWATTIRQKALDKINEAWSGVTPQSREELEAKERFDRFIAWLTTTKVTARWWIDNRDLSDSGLYTPGIEKIIKEFEDAN